MFSLGPFVAQIKNEVALHQVAAYYAKFTLKLLRLSFTVSSPKLDNGTRSVLHISSPHVTA
jgi:hypothetical protein